MTVASNRKSPTADKTKISPPISWRKAAKALGVDVGHLYHVIINGRQSDSLRRRYQELLESLGE